jgi:murein endopeptidase
MVRLTLAILALLATGVGLVIARAAEMPPERGADTARDGSKRLPPAPAARTRPLPPLPSPAPVPPLRERIRWRRSVAVGQPWAGRLVRGVQLPSHGPGYATWDPVLKRTPNRDWRRWGTDRLVRVLLRAIASYRRAHPSAPPVLVGDLSRPRGGDFGPQFGSIGHMTHQNGLDADLYYPRLDRRPAAARRVDQVDRRLAQALVDALIREGASVALVGPNTGLRGPAGRVKPFPNHDDHVHVRIPAR